MRKINIKTNVLVLSIIGFISFVSLVGITQTSMYYGLWRDNGNIINKQNTELEKLKKDLNYYKKKSQSKDSFKLDVYEKMSSRFNKLLDVVYDTSKKYEVNPYIIAGIIKAESAFNPRAQSFYRSGNPCAYGLMQVNMGAWKKELLINPMKIFNISYNVDLGVQIFKKYLNMARGDLARALFYYNNGESGYYNNTKYAPKVIKFINAYYEEDDINDRSNLN